MNNRECIRLRQAYGAIRQPPDKVTRMKSKTSRKDTEERRIEDSRERAQRAQKKEK